MLSPTTAWVNTIIKFADDVKVVGGITDEEEVRGQTWQCADDVKVVGGITDEEEVRG